MKNLKGMGWTLLGVALLSINLTSCGDDFDDAALQEDMNELADRISRLEKVCEELNANIASLETLIKAVEQQDYITSVKPVVKDGAEIGYTVTFAKNSPITIYQGKDGANGTSPQLTVEKGEDDIYYWKVDGKWLLNEGRKLPVTGTDGKDGVTPLLEIREGCWFVSCDQGKTWKNIGKATGDQGQAMFQSVTYTDAEMTFTLSDGTVLTVPLQQAALTSIRYVDAKANNIAVVDNENHEGGQLSMDFYLTPKEAVKSVASNWSEKVRMKAFYTKKARSNTFVDLPVLAVATDTVGGTIQVTASGQNLSSEFYHKTLGAKVILEIQHNDRVLVSEPVRIESNKALNNMIKYQSTLDIFTEMTNSNRWNDYNVTSYTYDELDRWLIFDKDVTEIPNSGFSGGVTFDNITSMTLPESVKRIGDDAFGWCKKLAEIRLSKGVKEIGESAFSNCYKLAEVNFPEGLETIGKSAFYYTDLKEVTLPNTVQSVGQSAFTTCYKLEKFHGKFATADNRALVKEDTLLAFAGGAPISSWTVPANVTYIVPFVFGHCEHLKQLTLPAGLKKIADSGFVGCKALESIDIPNSVTSIGMDAFSACESLKHVNLSSSMKEISETLFWGCSALESITIPNSIEKIGGVAFSSCTALTSIDIPSSVKIIGGNAFQTCSGLKKVQLHENLRELSRGVFVYCDGLTEITIPSTVTAIGEMCFYRCDNLTSVTVKATTPPDGYDFGFTDKTTVYVPAASLEAYKADEDWASYKLQPIP